MDNSAIFTLHTPKRYKFTPAPGATVDDLMLLFSALHLEVDEIWLNNAPETLRRHFQLIGPSEIYDQSVNGGDFDND